MLEQTFLHPFVIHFPLVLLPLSVGLDLAAWMKRQEQWHTPAYLLLVLGTLSCVIAVLTGTRAAAPYESDADLSGLIGQHENLSTLVMLLFLFTSLGRLPLQLRRQFGDWKMKLWVLFAVVGCVLVWQTGYYGGRLVYEFGIGVRL